MQQLFSHFSYYIICYLFFFFSLLKMYFCNFLEQTHEKNWRIKKSRIQCWWFVLYEYKKKNKKPMNEMAPCQLSR